MNITKQEYLKLIDEVIQNGKFRKYVFLFGCKCIFAVFAYEIHSSCFAQFDL